MARFTSLCYFLSVKDARGNPMTQEHMKTSLILILLTLIFGGDASASCTIYNGTDDPVVFDLTQSSKYPNVTIYVDDIDSFSMWCSPGPELDYVRTYVEGIPFNNDTRATYQQWFGANAVALKRRVLGALSLSGPQ